MPSQDSPTLPSMESFIKGDDKKFYEEYISKKLCRARLIRENTIGRKRLMRNLGKICSFDIQPAKLKKPYWGRSLIQGVHAKIYSREQARCARQKQLVRENVSYRVHGLSNLNKIRQIECELAKKRLKFKAMVRKAYRKRTDWIKNEIERVQSMGEGRVSELEKKGGKFANKQLKLQPVVGTVEESHL